jgi:hypothetical protein
MDGACGKATRTRKATVRQIAQFERFEFEQRATIDCAAEDATTRSTASTEKPPATEQYKQIETNLVECLKGLGEKAESYAAQTTEALKDTVDDIKSVIEQAQARRMS